MSLKLAEKKSGIENALVLLASLPPSQTIEQTATALFTQLQIGARRNARGVLYLYSAKENLLKIEVSYALEGEIPDIYCRRLEEAAKTYMLSEVPQDFISELIITTNLRGTGELRDAGRRITASIGSARISVGRRRIAGARLSQDAGRLRSCHPSPARGATARNSCRPRMPICRYSAILHPSKPASAIHDSRSSPRAAGFFAPSFPAARRNKQRIGKFFRSGGPYRLIFAGDLALAVPPPGSLQSARSCFAAEPTIFGTWTTKLKPQPVPPALLRTLARRHRRFSPPTRTRGAHVRSPGCLQGRDGCAPAVSPYEFRRVPPQRISL